MSSGNRYQMGAKQQIYLPERSTRRPVTGPRLVCIRTTTPTHGDGLAPCRLTGPTLRKELAPRSPLAWMMSHAAAQICLPASPTPLQAALVHAGEGKMLYHLFVFSLTHYFYFSCRQAIAKIPTHQHTHRCKLSCPQPPEKEQLIPSSPRRAILNLLQKRQEGGKGYSQLLKVILVINIHGIQAKKPRTCSLWKWRNGACF